MLHEATILGKTALMCLALLIAQQRTSAKSNVADLSRKLDDSKQIPLSNFVVMASELGFAVQYVCRNWDRLKLETPGVYVLLILRNGNTVVAMISGDSEDIRISDPLHRYGEILTLPRAELERVWDGDVLLVVPHSVEGRPSVKQANKPPSKAMTKRKSVKVSWFLLPATVVFVISVTAIQWMTASRLLMLPSLNDVCNYLLPARDPRGAIEPVYSDLRTTVGTINDIWAFGIIRPDGKKTDLDMMVLEENADSKLTQRAGHPHGGMQGLMAGQLDVVSSVTPPSAKQQQVQRTRAEAVEASTSGAVSLPAPELTVQRALSLISSLRSMIIERILTSAVVSAVAVSPSTSTLRESEAMLPTRTVQQAATDGISDTALASADAASPTGSTSFDAQQTSQPTAAYQPAVDAEANSWRALSSLHVEFLLTRGDECFSAGDLTSARLFYRRAADAGVAVAALRLGETFDPVFLDSVGLKGITGNVDQAMYWYSLARHLGSPEAEILLHR